MATIRSSTREDYLKRINIVTEYINNNLDSELDLTRLAEVSNFSIFHFHRITRAFLGEPLGCYITRVRMETAAKFLRYSRLSIQDISFSIGYETPSSLSKTFRQFYNVSPTEYRNNKELMIIKRQTSTAEANIKFRTVADIPARTAIYITIKGEYGNSGYADAWNRLWSFVREQKLYSAGIEHLGISFNDPKVTEGEKCRYDACLVIHKPVDPKDGVGVKEITGGRFAVFIYQGSYNGLDKAYDTIFSRWLPDSGYELRNAPCIEKYLNTPQRTAPDKLKTEIYLPIN